MRTTFALALCLTLQAIPGGNRQTARGALTRQNQTSVSRFEVVTESLDLVDRSRNREVPVTVYAPAPARKISTAKRSKLKLAIISHGYGGKHTDYFFIARNLVAHGYPAS
jgi:predicted dienelactone hydrolase